MNFQIKKYRWPTIPIPRKRGKNNIKYDKVLFNSHVGIFMNLVISKQKKIHEPVS